MKRIYICEKPAQAVIVAKALGGGRRTEAAIEGDGWAVVWAVGHLIMLQNPEQYNESFKPWSWDAIPVLPEVFQFIPKDARAASHIKAIHQVIKTGQEVIIATDPDREGEMIGREILVRLGWKGPVRRLWISDLTIPGVKQALQSIKPGAETEALYFAALARTQADWMVGMNLTKAATLRFRQGSGSPFSIGRVQTPVLALLVRQERLIKNFKPEDYYLIEAQVESEGHRFKMMHVPPPAARLKDLAQAQALALKAKGAKGPLKVVQEEKTQNPPPLFDLNLLQQEANSRFGWSADKTLKVTQKLYEEHQLLTYPRTDCQVLPEDHQAHLPELMSMLLQVPLLQPLAGLLKTPILRKAVYDDKKVGAHFAIVPTLKAPDWSQLNPDERKLWELVARQFLAAHMPEYRYLSTSIEFLANTVLFKAGGSVPRVLGWKEAFKGVEEADPNEEKDPKDKGRDEEESSNLPPVKDGALAHAESTRLIKKTTTPPARFTEKTLLNAMKNIASYVEDENARKRLRQTSGIGTSATRANIIETLKIREYMVVQKRQLVPTEVGMGVILAMETVVPSYCDPALTAAWEDILEDIAQGARPAEPFVQATKNRIRQDVELIRTSQNVQMVKTQVLSAPAKGKPSTSKASAQKPTPSKPYVPSADRVASLKAGTPLTVKYDDRQKAKDLGAMWDGDRKQWIAPKGADLAAFKKAGFVGGA